jgi:hypothetical protein
VTSLQDSRMFPRVVAGSKGPGGRVVCGGCGWNATRLFSSPDDGSFRPIFGASCSSSNWCSGVRDETYLKCLNGMRPGAEAASDRTKSGEAMLRKAAMNGAARRAMFRESCYTRPTCSESIFFLCGRLCELRPCDVDFPRLEHNSAGRWGNVCDLLF